MFIPSAAQAWLTRINGISWSSWKSWRKISGVRVKPLSHTKRPQHIRDEPLSGLWVRLGGFDTVKVIYSYPYPPSPKVDPSFHLLGRKSTRSNGTYCYGREYWHICIHGSRLDAYATWMRCHCNPSWSVLNLPIWACAISTKNTSDRFSKSPTSRRFDCLSVHGHPGIPSMRPMTIETACASPRTKVSVEVAVAVSAWATFIALNSYIWWVVLELNDQMMKG